jgi:hypothetical protein
MRETDVREERKKGEEREKERDTTLGLSPLFTSLSFFSSRVTPQKR